MHNLCSHSLVCDFIHRTLTKKRYKRQNGSGSWNTWMIHARAKVTHIRRSSSAVHIRPPTEWYSKITKKTMHNPRKRQISRIEVNSTDNGKDVVPWNLVCYASGIAWFVYTYSVPKMYQNEDQLFTLYEGLSKYLRSTLAHPSSNRQRTPITNYSFLFASV